MARFESPAADHKRVAKNTVVLYVRMLAVMAIGLYTGRVVFNALGVEDFGLRDVASGVIGMITFLMGSLSMASSRFLVVDRLPKFMRPSFSIGSSADQPDRRYLLFSENMSYYYIK